MEKDGKSLQRELPLRDCQKVFYREWGAAKGPPGTPLARSHTCSEASPCSTVELLLQSTPYMHSTLCHCSEAHSPMFRVWCKEKIARFLFVNSVIWGKKKKKSLGEKDGFQSSTVKFLLGVAIPFSMGVEREGTGIPSISPAPVNPYHMVCEILGA